jgi:aminocarboxymuconate-semialdehyde decarboxylase
MSGITTARVIDLHAHVVLEETLGAAGHYGPELGMRDGRPYFRVGEYVLDGVRYRGSPFMDTNLRLAAMDTVGIDFQVLSPNPLTYFHFVDAATAADFCRRHNDVLAALVARHPQRLAGLAALPMQDPVRAADEARRAVGELGLLGVAIGSDFGHPLDAPSLDPFYETLVGLDVPLFIHPAPAGIDGPAGDPNLKRFDLDIVAGFAAQETLAVATLIYGEVLDRHPKLDIWISHGGGAAIFLLGRLADAGRKRAWASAALRADGAFEGALQRLWFDTHVHAPRSFAMLREIVGDDRLVFGTNFAGWDQGTTGDVRTFAGPFAGNARRLLRRS